MIVGTMTKNIEEVIKEELLTITEEEEEIMEITKIKKVVKKMISRKVQLSLEIIEEVMIVEVIMLIKTNGNKKTPKKK